MTKGSGNITVRLDQPDLLENLVEQLARRRYDIGFCNQVVPEGWQGLEVSSAEIYTSGSLSFSPTAIEPAINLPFITAFLFTCIKTKDGDYQLALSSSLS